MCLYVHSTDIESTSNSSAPAEGRAEKPLWSRSDNAWQFNFFPEKSPPPQEAAGRTEPATSSLSFIKQGSAFAFNFQIPLVTPEEDMETAETPDASCPGSQQCIQDEKHASNPEPSVQSKAKKKKKSGKKKASESTEPQQKPSEGRQGNEDTVLVSAKCFL